MKNAIYFTLALCFTLHRALFAQTAGTLDVSFSDNGKQKTAFGAKDEIRATALAANGNIVSVGYSGNDIAVTMHTQGGSLVTSFSGDGKQITTLPNSNEAQANGVAIQADGKIVVVGSFRSTLDNHFKDFFILRYLSDGNLDASFSGDGIVQFDSHINDYYYAVAIQPDGKIVAVGTQNSQFVVRRYLSSGALDATFGNAGTVFGVFQGEAKSLALQPDGKIVVVGTSLEFMADRDFGVLRLNINGTLDTTFDTDGKVLTDVGTNTEDNGTGVALQDDGKIIVAGYTWNGSNYDIALVRYNPNGSLDTGFSGNGKLRTGIGSGDDVANAAEVQADGKIVVAGTTRTAAYTYEILHLDGTREIISVPANDDMVVVRYSSSGNLDATFSGDGKNIISFEEGKNDQGNAMFLQLDGKIVVAGITDNDFALARLHGIYGFNTLANRIYTTIGTSFEIANAIALDADRKIVVAGYSYDGAKNVFAITRYHPSGHVDSTFSGDGKQTVSVGLNTATAYAVVIQPADGKILLAGSASNGTNSDFAVIRLLPNGSLDNTFGTGGKVLIPIKDSDFCVAMKMQSDGKIVLAGNSHIDGGASFISAVRLNSNGSLDTGFDADGKVAIDASAEAKETKSLAIHTDKLFIGGKTVGTGGFFALKLNANGSLDTSFDSDGIVTTSFAGLFGAGDDIAVQADGKVLLGGMLDSRITILRYNVNGSLDNTFSNNGRATINFNPFASAISILVQTDGKILVGGNASNDMGLARLKTNGGLDNTFGIDGTYIVPKIGYQETFSGMAVNPFGKIYMAGNHYNGTDNDFYLGVFVQCKVPELNLTHDPHDVNTVLTSPYEAQGIKASNWILGSGKAEYRSKTSVVLQPGFKVEKNAVFTAEINRNFCSYTLDSDAVIVLVTHEAVR